MTRPAAVAGLLVLVAACALASSASAGGDASRVVDRTFSCEAGYVGGLYQVLVGATFSAGPGSSELRASAFVTKDLHEADLGVASSGEVGIHRRLCSPARRTVTSTTKGMSGGAVPSLGASFKCATPPRVLLRLRAVFERPVTPHTVNLFGFPRLVASGEVVQAALVVGTLTGKTLAYVSVNGAERARLFTRPTCEEE